jgi:hypothetical protein
MSVLDGGELKASRSVRFIPEETGPAVTKGSELMSSSPEPVCSFNYPGSQSNIGLQHF